MTQKLGEIDAELNQVKDSLDKVFSKAEQPPKQPSPTSAPVIPEPGEEKSEEEHIEEIKNAVGVPVKQPAEEKPEGPTFSVLGELKKQVKEDVDELKVELAELEKSSIMEKKAEAEKAREIEGEVMELEKSTAISVSKEKEMIQELQKQIDELKTTKAVDVQEELKFVESSLLQTVDHLTTQADKINQMITEVNGIKTAAANSNYRSTKHIDDLISTMKLMEKNVQYIYGYLQQAGAKPNTQNPNVR